MILNMYIILCVHYFAQHLLSVVFYIICSYTPHKNQSHKNMIPTYKHGHTTRDVQSAK